MPTVLHSPATWTTNFRLGSVLAVSAGACALTFCISVQPSAPAAPDAAFEPARDGNAQQTREAAAGKAPPSRWKEYWLEVSRAAEAL